MKTQFYTGEIIKTHASPFAAPTVQNAVQSCIEEMGAGWCLHRDNSPKKRYAIDPYQAFILRQAARIKAVQV